MKKMPFMFFSVGQLEFSLCFPRAIMCPLYSLWKSPACRQDSVWNPVSAHNSFTVRLCLRCWYNEPLYLILFLTWFVSVPLLAVISTPHIAISTNDKFHCGSHMSFDDSAYVFKHFLKRFVCVLPMCSFYCLSEPSDWLRAWASDTPYHPCKKHLSTWTNEIEIQTPLMYITI